jgi:hypothetical protein
MQKLADSKNGEFVSLCPHFNNESPSPDFICGAQNIFTIKDITNNKNKDIIPEFLQPLRQMPALKIKCQVCNNYYYDTTLNEEVEAEVRNFSIETERESILQ